MTKIESPVLRRLGPVPFWRGEKRCFPELSRIYARAMERAREELVHPKSERQNREPPTRGGFPAPL